MFFQHHGHDGGCGGPGRILDVTDTLLCDLVATSRDVREASRRLDKVGRLAAFLSRLGAEEIETAVAFLCGSLPQGRIGVGFSALSEVRSAPAASAPVLTLAAVDSAFEQVAVTRGPRLHGLSRPAATPTCWRERRLTSRNSWCGCSTARSVKARSRA